MSCVAGMVACLVLCAVGTVRSSDADVMCEHSACMEYGSPDADCCALRTDGGCSAGFNYFTGRNCYTPNGAVDTCCLPDTCVKEACLEYGAKDSDCCGLDDETSCLPPYEKQLGDECWLNGARRTCCVLPTYYPLCEHSACTEYGRSDADCCALSTDGGCDVGFTYFTGSTCYTYNGAKETCCVSDATCAASACLENGMPDSDCCGVAEDTSCEPGYTKILGDICWEPNGARRTCCTPDELASSVKLALSAQQEVIASGVNRQRKSLLVGFGVGSGFVLMAGAYASVKARRRYGAPDSKEPLLD